MWHGNDNEVHNSENVFYDQRRRFSPPPVSSKFRSIIEHEQPSLKKVLADSYFGAASSQLSNAPTLTGKHYPPEGAQGDFYNDLLAHARATHDARRRQTDAARNPEPFSAILAGEPGAGKSTLLKRMTTAVNELYGAQVLWVAAPYGKQAKNISGDTVALSMFQGRFGQRHHADGQALSTRRTFPPPAKLAEKHYGAYFRSMEVDISGDLAGHFIYDEGPYM